MNCAFIKGHLVAFLDSLLVKVASTPLGLKLATSTICNENSTRLDSDTYSSILGLLLEELWCMPDVSHRVHLDVLVAFYTVNGGDQGSDSVSFFFRASASYF